ncbi:HAMP domain-containing histidine kinase [Sulfitobacter sp. S223]|uniref:sensor histidine kinase n=1 Tax=Sulfitobacter sp. S223 TaxID=2867023 RepID=UPI0021A5C0CC|nr:HAMP domain-containing sensor histidine kinase [Sulfitobacter sp. S223]UWR27094.1 HAMP domain-containing histidine kinase [Sulfitobacter sp. S223]
MRTASLAQAASSEGPKTETQDVDDFIYLMSHDVRASVRALLELPQWIAEDLHEAGVELTGPVLDTISMMNRHTARLDRMLVDLLAYSRIGRMQDIVRVDLGVALEDVMASLKVPEGITLEHQLECKDVMMGEQDALLMLSALIGNAVKHHDTGSGEVKITTRPEGDMIRITVCDDGPGIPARFHSKALSAMTTLRPRDEVEGTGMGLANVRKVAEHYGGKISLSEVSEKDSGLRVDVLVPRG